MPPKTGISPTWIATEATITSCRFQFARVSTFTLGVQTQDKFRITFDYYAHGQTHAGEFQSPVAIPQGEHIPISYNPLDPKQNSREPGAASEPGTLPLWVVGVAGSIVLSLLWLGILRGCS